jgi:hypothetical protein
MNMRVRRGKHWMIQSSARWAGPLNFGVHVCLRGCKYIDLHLPFTVITLGCIDRTEYPPWWWGCSKDIRSGVKYDDGSNQ